MSASPAIADTKTVSDVDTGTSTQAGAVHNLQVQLASRAVGLPAPSNFKTHMAPALKAEDLKDGEVLVKTLWLSVDPYMRGRIGSDAKKSSSKPLSIGDVIVGATVGQVVASRSCTFAVGQYVHAYSGWQQYYIKPDHEVTQVRPEWGPLEKWVGVLGMTGLTAYYGLMYVGEPMPGETVVVSGAAGAVGSVVVQLAKIHGCRVVGIAGTAEKVRYLTSELGADIGINRKTDDIPTALDAACPTGVDVYFDNTGGVVSDEVLKRIAHKGRIAICGQISEYNTESPSLGPRLLHHLLWNSARMQGFLVQDWEDKDEETLELLGTYIREGKLKSKEDIVEGLERAPEAFCRLFNGSNFGKQTVHVADPTM